MRALTRRSNDLRTEDKTWRINLTLGDETFGTNVQRLLKVRKINGLTRRNNRRQEEITDTTGTNARGAT